MNRRVPLLAVVLGIAGLAPFILLGLLALSPDPVQARRTTLLLVAYGAVVLSFLGAVHWGLALAHQGLAPAAGERARFGLGVVPALVGWAALALPVLDLPFWSGLLVLIVGFGATVLVEHRAAARGARPARLHVAALGPQRRGARHAGHRAHAAHARPESQLMSD